MESNNSSTDTNDMLAKLNRLESQVSTLSLQLQTNQETIDQLKLSLNERESHIQELEARLIVTPYTLLQNVITIIHQCRQQIKNGIDEKIINPSVTQIQKQIEIIQAFVYESTYFINKKRMLIYQNIHITTNAVNRYPQQIKKNFRIAMALLERKVIHPCKVLYEEITVALLALPSQSQIIFQIRVLDPALQQMEAAAVFGKKFYSNALVWLNESISRLKTGSRQAVVAIGEKVKKSSFWDGKHRMHAAYQ